MLNRIRRRRGERAGGRRRPEPGGVCLAVAAAFALVAALTSASALRDSRGVSSDLRNGIAPRFVAADADPAVVALLERTGMLAEDFAIGMLPIAARLGRAADATTAAAADAESIRDHVGSIRDSFAGADGSTASVSELATALAPAIVAVFDGTGDIATALAGAQRRSTEAAQALERVLRELGGFATDVGSLRERTRAIEAALKRIEEHGSRIASARPLDCPRSVVACLP
ncbi:MAG: hypothetical protein ACT4QF_11225 [Sporichthyaceae bacterium]